MDPDLGVDDQCTVSIPQSGFLVVKRCFIFAFIAAGLVSIPQSGFLVVKL